MKDLVVSADVLTVDIIIYVAISMAVFGIMDVYAAKKMGRQSEGMKALRPYKFVMLLIVCGLSAILLVLCMKGLTMKATTETFIGVPYLACWFYYMTCVLRRVKAETKGR